MYIWRKRATADWLRRRNEDLLRRFGSALAIIEQPGKARTLVEVSCGTRKEALQIRREFGGTIEKLRADWLEQLAKRNRAKPLRIGSRLIVSRTRAPKSEGSANDCHSSRSRFRNGRARHHGDVFANARTDHAQTGPRLVDARRRNRQRHPGHRGELPRRESNHRDRQRSPRLRRCQTERRSEPESTTSSFAPAMF